MQRAPTRTTREQQSSGVGMAENGAVQNELTLRHVVDGISALVAVLTPDGAVEIVNRQVLDYFGKTLDEMRAWSSSDAVHPDDLPGHRKRTAVRHRSPPTGRGWRLPMVP